MNDLILSILTSVGGSTVLLALCAWIGKRHLDIELQTERKKHQEELAHIQSEISKELEFHKNQLKYDERFFDHLFNASMDLFKIRQFVLPKRTYPDMDWPDAVDIIVSNFEKIEAKLEEFIEQYYTALPPDIYEKLNSAIVNCREGGFAPDPDQYQIADEVYTTVDSTCTELKSHVDEKRQVKSATYFKK